MFMPQLLLHWKQYGCSISGKLRLITMNNCIQDYKKLNKTRKNTPTGIYIDILSKLKLSLTIYKVQH